MSMRGHVVTDLRDQLIDDMKRIFGRDGKRIEHALAVLDYAERIHSVEGGDSLIVKAAAILHDIGILEAERKYGSSAGKYQEMEGPPIAEDILKRYDISVEAIDHITRIIANHHSARDIDTIEFRIIWDADWLVNIPADFPDADDEKRYKIVNKVFKTREGYRIAKELFIKS
ncbi:MAG: HD domain-containing protein [Sedimentisphaerales bacterium]|nr:HD domain-containing protein [Sedimentisphaerales bacterium]